MTVWPSERGWMPEVAGLVGDPAENRSSKERTDLSLRTGAREATRQHRGHRDQRSRRPLQRQRQPQQETPASIRMMEPSCAATAARRLSPWRMPSTPRLDAWIVPRPRRDSPRSRPHHGSQTEALSRQRPGRGRLRPRKNAIIPQNYQIVPISPRAGQGAVAAVHGGRPAAR